MPLINCPLDNCIYATPDVDAAVAASLLKLRNNVHINEKFFITKASKVQRWTVLVLGYIVLMRFGTRFCKN